MTAADALTAAGRRVLVLVPHPDDEVVGCAALIGRLRSRGAEVFAAYLTTGVPAVDLLWPWQRRGHPAWIARRRAEAAAAADRLGLTPLLHQDVPTRGLKTQLAETRRRLLGLIDDNAIDALWVPAYEGGHQDHDVANALGATLAGRLPVWEFAEYNRAGGRVRSQTFPTAGDGEIFCELDAAERAEKRKLLAFYASERGNLGYVKSGVERLRPLAAYDYARPPHPGTLFYQRFQWVPFRHPRVDFTDPSAVCAAIEAFRRQTEMG